MDATASHGTGGKAAGGAVSGKRPLQPDTRNLPGQRETPFAQPSHEDGKTVFRIDGGPRYDGMLGNNPRRRLLLAQYWAFFRERAGLYFKKHCDISLLYVAAVWYETCSPQFERHTVGVPDVEAFQDEYGVGAEATVQRLVFGRPASMVSCKRGERA